ncbi:Flp pilus assembly protein CpaB [Kordiimonas aquimaris]|uniref:Flp pilus assembly protein CpaB n=1 Tax=Kordiimonas aquimaris TaxID=707591 RepID=UPI0021D36A4B|nr:Flp pilus assembly protein CpaB [Kordiimonas aquimaris]
MNPRNLILITVALIGVVGVVFFTRSFLEDVTRQSQQVQAVTLSAPAARILVAAKELPVGTILTADHTIWQAWPEEGVNEAYFVDGQQKPKDLEGKVVRSPISLGEPMTKSSLVAQGERGFMAAVLSPGMRAATVKLSPVAGIGGFIFPGDRVDVILTHTIEVSRSEKYTAAETVFQNVRVLAVDQRSAAQGDKIQIAKTATLEVTPKMAEKVAMLENIGSLSLSLRSLANAGGDPLDANPDSPPISRTLTHTLGHEVSQFLPEMDAETSAGTIRISRGNQLTTIDTGNASKKDKNTLEIGDDQ